MPPSKNLALNNISLSKAETEEASSFTRKNGYFLFGKKKVNKEKVFGHFVNKHVHYVPRSSELRELITFFERK